MNLILLDHDDFIDASNHARLTGRRLGHVLTVHRAAAGDELRVGLLNGSRGTGIVTRLDRETLEMDVRLVSPPPPKIPLTLVLALPRPKVLRRVLRSATALGIERIVLLNCSRVEKSYWQSPFLSAERIREQLVLGLEQAQDTVLPEVRLERRFKPFVEDELPAIIRGTLSLVAHPAAPAPCPRTVGRATTLAVGPEGGFLPYEIEKFAACGFTPMSMGERTLSVETAVPALIAKLF